MMDDDLKKCMTPAAIERYFQRRIKDDRLSERPALRRACNERAREIAPRCRRGHLLALRLDKGRGSSARYVVDGKVYKTGTWGNGAGYRWAMADFERWYEGLLRAGGLRKDLKIKLIIEWAREGYLWRALRHLA